MTGDRCWAMRRKTGDGRRKIQVGSIQSEVFSGQFSDQWAVLQVMMPEI
jgi:hypothetical protein